MSNVPIGASLGFDSNKQRPKLIDYVWALEHGSRAQRREIIRLLKAYSRNGDAEATEILLAVSDPNRSSMSWRITLPGRQPFVVLCPQKATEAEIKSRWPGAIAEALDAR